MLSFAEFTPLSNPSDTGNPPPRAIHPPGYNYEMQSRVRRVSLDRTIGHTKLTATALRKGSSTHTNLRPLSISDSRCKCSRVLVRPLGISCEAAMDEPYYATSFSNFWGKRWDRPMQTILYSGAFQPMRKGCGSVGVGGAVFVTFIVSGVVHTLGVAACGWVSAQSCVSMMCFFLLQAVFVLVEGVLKRPAGMYLTQTLTWITSPLARKKRIF